MSCVPGGELIRGRNNGPPAERPQARVSVDAFYMDVYEVTSADYKACIAAGACRKAGPNYRGFSRPKQPVVGISWFDSRDFCGWKGKRLPTEAEWERAARGDDDRLYAWGKQRPTCKRAIIFEPDAHEENGCNTGKTWAVGKRAPTLYGLYDMAGNSWEWVADWYSESYAACGEACLGHNPKGPCGGADECPGHDKRIVRGGSWYWDYKHATTTRRRPHFPKNKPFHHFGFRCAKSAGTGASGPR